MLDLNSFEPDKFDLSGNNNPISGLENKNINVNDEEEQKRILARQEEAEKEQKSSIVSAPTEGQPLSNPTEESLANPILPTPDASKELNDVKELTSKLKTTMQTISLAKNSLIY